MAEERAVVERSLNGLRKRQVTLDGLSRHPELSTAVDVADAALALQATAAQAEFFHDDLRPLGSRESTDAG
jgi:hypothetical protein